MRYATWSYDAQGRAIGSRHAERVEAVTLDYNTPGQTRVTDSQGQGSLYMIEKREGIGHVLSIQGPGRSSCGGGDVRYRYNDRHQVVERATWEGVSDRSGLSFGNGTRETRRYDAQGRVEEVRHERQLKLRYDYDPHGQIVGLDLDGMIQSYAYDAWGRLSEAETRLGAYRYDSLGNRLHKAHTDRSGKRVTEEAAYAETGQGNRLLGL